MCHLSTRSPTVAGEDIRVLKETLGVGSDAELAAALGVERSTVAQWRRRGSVPERYFGFLNLEHSVPRLARFFNAIRARIFSRPEHTFFLRAALSLLPEVWPQNNETGDESGTYREEIVVSLMNLAQLKSWSALGKAHPETTEDYTILLAAIRAEEAEVVALILEGEVPQSATSQSLAP